MFGHFVGLGEKTTGKGVYEVAIGENGAEMAVDAGGKQDKPRLGDRWGTKLRIEGQALGSTNGRVVSRGVACSLQSATGKLYAMKIEKSKGTAASVCKSGDAGTR